MTAHCLEGATATVDGSYQRYRDYAQPCYRFRRLTITRQRDFVTEKSYYFVTTRYKDDSTIPYATIY